MPIVGRQHQQEVHIEAPVADELVLRAIVYACKSMGDIDGEDLEGLHIDTYLLQRGSDGDVGRILFISEANLVALQKAIRGFIAEVHGQKAQLTNRVIDAEKGE